MRALLLTAILSSVTTVTLAADFGGDMESAREQCGKDGKPMFLLIGATWCQACHQVYDPQKPMERQSRTYRLLASAGHFVYWDADARKADIERYRLGGTIPCLTVLRMTKDGWTQHSYRGLKEISDYVSR